jgi:hypothetical protein
MSGAHDAHHGHGGGHATGHGPAEAAEGGHEPAPLSKSERYELADLFPEEAPENQHFVQVAGTVVLIVLLALALAYPFIYT